MKRKLFLLLVFFEAISTNAQVAKWMIPAVYDTIRMENNGNVIVTDSVFSQILWSINARRLAVTEDSLMHFKNNYAVTLRPTRETITGFYDRYGNFTSLRNCTITHNYPYFVNGFLLVKEGSSLHFVNTDAKTVGLTYENAYPFSNGYAAGTAYKDSDRKKDPYPVLVTARHEPVVLNADGKELSDEDIDFISSVNDEGIGVVVAQKKVYFFHADDQKLTPVSPERENDEADQVKIDGSMNKALLKQPDGSSVLYANAGKGKEVSITFDAIMIPLSVMYDSGEYVYQKKADEPVNTPLQTVEKDGKLGIVWPNLNNAEVLPPQFTDVPLLYEDRAFVKVGRKYGMVAVNLDEGFRLTLNRGDNVPFRHQKLKTVIRLDMPVGISSSDTQIEVDPDSGCEVDLTSVEGRDTNSGNYIQYNCVLTIPESLPDDQLKEISYPVKVRYEGLLSPTLDVKANAWHYKYYNIDVRESETTIKDGEVNFIFDIHADRLIGEELYPYIVAIQTDNLQTEIEKITETQYKCKVKGLKNGLNVINVQVFEEGCPPVTYPFDVTYSRPSATPGNRTMTSEKVEIKKKATPHLDI